MGFFNMYKLDNKPHYAENRNRTGTVVTYRRILSPVRLPVPPPRHIRVFQWALRDSNPRPIGYEPTALTN